ncbi:GTPase IMAP family member 8-like [Arapaima gigas]
MGQEHYGSVRPRTKDPKDRKIIQSDVKQSESQYKRLMDEVRLVLLGRRGSGKSSCGNTILGRKMFRSLLSTTPVTTECEEHTTTIHGRRVTVIDTPDFFGDSLPDPDSHIRKCISTVGREPSVFLLVLQLGHFTEGEKKIVTQVQQAFQFNFTQKMIVLFSYGDDLEEVNVEEFMKNTHPDLKVLVEKCGNRYHVLNNRDTSDGAQVMELATKVENILNSDDGIPSFLADRPENIQLVLLGRRGSGKSSCGNTILGSKVFRTILSTTPVTTECEEHTATIHGRRVTVIDTPDFFDDSVPDPKSHIQKCISMVGREPSVFLLVLQLGHFTEGEKKIVTQMQQEFGSKVKNMIVVFSYGDDLEDVTIEEFMKNTHPDLKDLVEKCGNRYHVLNNRDTSDGEQVRELVRKAENMLNPKEAVSESTEASGGNFRDSKESCRDNINMVKGRGSKKNPGIVLDSPQNRCWIF